MDTTFDSKTPNLIGGWVWFGYVWLMMFNDVPNMANCG
jgi:hypothetical protein